MLRRVGINPLRFVQELLIVALETLGMLLVSLGLGVVASCWFGLAGLLTISGVCLLGFATLAATRQRAMHAPPKQQ